jgi:hypothetical protein
MGDVVEVHGNDLVHITEKSGATQVVVEVPIAGSQATSIFCESHQCLLVAKRMTS